LKEKKNLIDSKNTIDQIQLQQGQSIGAVYALSKVADQLGITKALGNTREGTLALWIVLARIIDQGSRLSAVRLAKQHAACDILNLDSFNEDHLYYTLDWLCDNQLRIEKKLFKNKYGDTAPTLFLYDVTSSYLEGECNELGNWGFSRDKKKGKLQIVIGLLTDPEGDPITVEAFEGNTQDPQTVHNQIIKLSEKFGCKEVTLVGDRGMIKKCQIDELHGEEFHFITAITKPQIQSLMKKGTIQLELFTEHICEVEDDGCRYILRRNPQRQIEIQASRQSKIQKVTEVIAKKNQYLEEHKKARVRTVKKDVKSLLVKLDIIDFAGLTFKGRVVQLNIEEEKLQEISLLDGCYAIKTDLLKEVIVAEKIHERYKDLKFVEAAFRMMKTELLEVRPLYLRSETRTRGHLVEIMLAYKISRYLRIQWSNIECTVDEGITTLSMICGIITQVGPLMINKIPEPTDMGMQLLDSLGIALPESMIHKEVNVDTRKHLKDERKNL
jgi:transposase